MILYMQGIFMYRSAPMALMNTTGDFHRNIPIDLMKEFTICESFATEDSPYAVILKRPTSYGAMLGDFLIGKGLLKEGSVICEMGCGYGSLMHGLLNAYSPLIERVFMVDLSGRLIRKQQQRLSDWSAKITSIQADIHDAVDAIRGMGIFIVNEVMGDLNTMTDIDPGNIPEEAAAIIEKYDLEIPSEGHFCLNVGAMRLVEALCRKDSPAFLSEHSCDPVMPREMAWLKRDLELDSFPREIRLYRHSEYTIRFSHLMKIARAHGKTVETGPLLDLVPLIESPCLRMIFTCRACSTERQEIIYELLDHIREYRWMIIR